MNVPIVIDGQETGKLEIEREGSYTLFRGRCADPGRLLRLSVYGGEREGYVGVMMPEGGTVTVKKRYSRFDLRNFPDTIEYAGEAGKPRQREESAPEPPQECAEEQEGEREKAQPESVPMATETVLTAGDGEKTEDGEPPGDGGLLWYAAEDGTLYTRWEGRCFVAIPCPECGLPSERMLERRSIEGVEYAVYEAEE